MARTSVLKRFTLWEQLGFMKGSSVVHVQLTIDATECRGGSIAHIQYSLSGKELQRQIGVQHIFVNHFHL